MYRFTEFAGPNTDSTDLDTNLGMWTRMTGWILRNFDTSRFRNK